MGKITINETNGGCNMDKNNQFSQHELSDTLLIGLLFGLFGLHCFYLNKRRTSTANITYSNSSNIDQLGKLILLKEKGAISEEKYTDKKDILLDLIKEH
jgi:hypothetical protein